MFRFYNNQCGFDFQSLEDVMAAARESSGRARVVDSGGVMMNADYEFEDGVLVKMRVRLGDRMVNMMAAKN